MRARTATRLAGGSWGVSLALVLISLALLARNRGLAWELVALNAFSAVTFATVGALVAARRPRNRVGWLFCWIGLVSAALVFAPQYAILALATRPGTLPGGLLGFWLLNWLWPLSLIPATTFLPLWFPDGRLASRRWRPVAWLAGAVLAAGVVADAFRPRTYPVPWTAEPLANPFAVEALAGRVGFLGPVIVAGWLLAAGASIACLAVRLRRAAGLERQQLKWFAYAASLVPLGMLAAAATRPVGLVVLVATMLGVPVCAGVAILRHRLYDIDLVINRTLVYGALSATLAAVYFGGVALLQRAAGYLTGQQDSALAIVASTLAIAALFQPLRRRLQAFIDRRFYRRKYDAGETLAAFSATLRDETDLGRISADLLAVVEETMQPAHVSLWLRPPDREVRSEQVAP